MSDRQQDTVGLSLLRSASAASVAETVTIPLDTAKVRLQLQNISGAAAASNPKYRGPIGTIATIIREEGVGSPFKGLTPGIHRQIIFTGLRLGLYEHVRDWMAGETESSFAGRIAAALCTSAIGITFANPADVVKVRLQASTARRGVPLEAPAAILGVDGAGKPAHAAPAHTYPSATRAYRQIAAREGLIGGLYKGYVPNLLRNSIISATELVSYDTAKQALLDAGYQDGMPVHFTAGITAGFAATVLGSPWDVIGTRLMAEQRAQDAKAVSLPTFCMNMMRQEGFSSFYKGFVPNFARIGSFNIVLWLSYEQIRKLTNKLA